MEQSPVQISQEEKENLLNQMRASKNKKAIIFLVISCAAFALMLLMDVILLVGGIAADDGGTIAAIILSCLMMSAPFLAVFIVFLVLSLKSFKAKKLATEADVENAVLEQLRINNAGENGKAFRHCLEMENFKTTNDYGKLLKFDSERKLWCIPKELSKDGKHIKLYSFSDVAGVELYEDGAVKTTSETSGGTGKALAGGILFGGVGAVVGGMTAKRETNTTATPTCTMLQVRIKLNDIYSPIRFIDLITKEVDRTDKSFQKMYKFAHEIVALFEYICSENEKTAQTAADK